MLDISTVHNSVKFYPLTCIKPRKQNKIRFLSNKSTTKSPSFFSLWKCSSQNSTHSLREITPPALYPLISSASSPSKALVTSISIIVVATKISLHISQRAVFSRVAPLQSTHVYAVFYFFEFRCPLGQELKELGEHPLS